MAFPRTIVVGSGLAGSAAALVLAHAGLPVTLLEKNPRLGGSCSHYQRQGWRIDVGTHLFSRGKEGPLGDVLRRVDAEGAVRFRRTRDIAELRVAGPRGPEAPIPVPASALRLPTFVARVCRALRLGPRQALRSGRLFHYILAMPEPQIVALDEMTVEAFLEGWGVDDAVRGLFGFLLGLYFVVPYWEASAGEAIWAFQKMAQANQLSYPVGGAGAVPGTYCRLAAAHGADIRTGAGVRRILVRGGAVRGVELRSGERLPAEVVISTSSVRTTVLSLVGREHVPAPWAEWVEGLQGSAIAVQAKLALDRPLVSAGALVGAASTKDDLYSLDAARLRALFDDVAHGRVPDCVPFYAPVPTNFDPDLGPGQLITVCAVAPTTDVPLVDAAPRWEQAMLDALRAVVPDLDAHTVFCDRFSTRWLAHWIGKDFGPAISTAQVPGQVGRSRPPNTTPIAGLYIAGCGAGARGIGTELAAASGMAAADLVLAVEGLSTWRRVTPRRRRLSRRLCESTWTARGPREARAAR